MTGRRLACAQAVHALACPLGCPGLPADAQSVHAAPLSAGAQSVHARPLDVDCPTCWAEPRYACQDDTGEECPTHPARAAAVRPDAQSVHAWDVIRAAQRAASDAAHAQAVHAATSGETSPEPEHACRVGRHAACWHPCPCWCHTIGRVSTPHSAPGPAAGPLTLGTPWQAALGPLSGPPVPPTPVGRWLIDEDDEDGPGEDDEDGSSPCLTCEDAANPQVGTPAGSPKDHRRDPAPTSTNRRQIGACGFDPSEPASVGPCWHPRPDFYVPCDTCRGPEELPEDGPAGGHAHPGDLLGIPCPWCPPEDGPEDRPEPYRGPVHVDFTPDGRLIDVDHLADAIRNAGTPENGPAEDRSAPCPLDSAAGPCRCGPGSVRCRAPQEAPQDGPQDGPQEAAQRVRLTWTGPAALAATYRPPSAAQRARIADEQAQAARVRAALADLADLADWLADDPAEEAPPMPVTEHHAPGCPGPHPLGTLCHRARTRDPLSGPRTAQDGPARTGTPEDDPRPLTCPENGAPCTVECPPDGLCEPLAAQQAAHVAAGGAPADAPGMPARELADRRPPWLVDVREPIPPDALPLATGGRLYLAPIGTAAPAEAPETCAMAPYTEPGPQDTPRRALGILAGRPGATFDLPTPGTAEHTPRHPARPADTTMTTTFHASPALLDAFRALGIDLPALETERTRVRAVQAASARAMRALRRRAAYRRREA